MAWSAPPVTMPRRSNAMVAVAPGEVMVQPVHSVAVTARVTAFAVPSLIWQGVPPLSQAPPLRKPTNQGAAGLTVAVTRLAAKAEGCLITSERANSIRLAMASVWLTNRLRSKKSLIFGKATAARMASTTTVTISSMREMPRCAFRRVMALLVPAGVGGAVGCDASRQAYGDGGAA